MTPQISEGTLQHFPQSFGLGGDPKLAPTLFSASWNPGVESSDADQRACRHIPHCYPPLYALHIPLPTFHPGDHSRAWQQFMVKSGPVEFQGPSPGLRPVKSKYFLQVWNLSVFPFPRVFPKGCMTEENAASPVYIFR